MEDKLSKTRAQHFYRKKKKNLLTALHLKVVARDVIKLLYSPQGIGMINKKNSKVMPNNDNKTEMY